jgi:hypothetical protein
MASAAAQNLTATNGTPRLVNSALFPITGAFFPHPTAASTAPVINNQFSATLTSTFALPAQSTTFAGAETYRYQMRLLNAQNTAVTLTNGNNLLTTSEFLVSRSQYQPTDTRNQNFVAQPQTAPSTNSGNFSMSIILQRKTTDTTGFPTTVWKDEGTAVTLALQQETALPQLRVHSATSTEIRLAYNYSTSLGVEVYGRWKLRASTTLTANSFTELSGVTPVEFSPGIYHYIIPISPTEPQKFFRLSN